ncbi:MAG: IS110 family transposase [Candidatus Latescibacteria bacterium]|nr:IS110 family transposase [Candidatus Latescibacterota bacterium]NIM64495.1 IS110 family transposase [Candidatus Latescibacterota bacterium]NIO00648.1 IS110 family transposase [Candidatus Latescibacterota bacterium]NIO27051.1 IS110 family transposase [Candidatus Latescibacterota bacterium]NIO54575.1 IS110 family transposase [Candidatus Latescibacterota bacterium]
MLYVGLDAHWRQSSFCVLDGQGRKVLSRTVQGRWSKVLEEVGRVGRPFAICFEASTGYGYLYDGLRKITRRVVVAHPGQLRLIFRSKRKNDRADAEKLAKLLYLDAVPPIHAPSSEVRSWRRMIGHRQKLIGDRARVKNNIRAMLRSQGVSAPRGLWSRRGEEWLETAELSAELDMVQRDVLLERLRAIRAMIERVERELNRVASRHPGVELLKTIPGVGNRTAEAVVAWVDDPWRFRRVSRIGSYFGVVPSQDASGPVNRLGHITREGPSVVRGLLAEAAWQAIRRSDQVRSFYERVRRGDDERRKIALVATVHYLLRVMLTMLQTGEVWRDETS